VEINKPWKIQHPCCSASLRKIRSALTGGQQASLAYGGRALSAPPAPSPPKSKTFQRWPSWLSFSAFT